MIEIRFLGQIQVGDAVNEGGEQVKRLVMLAGLQGEIRGFCDIPLEAAAGIGEKLQERPTPVDVVKPRLIVPDFNGDGGAAS